VGKANKRKQQESRNKTQCKSCYELNKFLTAQECDATADATNYRSMAQKNKNRK